MTRLDLTNVSTLAETDQAFYNISVPVSEDVVTNHSVLTALVALQSLAHDEPRSIYIAAGGRPTCLDLKDTQRELELSEANLATANDEIHALKLEVIEDEDCRKKIETELVTLQDNLRDAESNLSDSQDARRLAGTNLARIEAALSSSEDARRLAETNLARFEATQNAQTERMITSLRAQLSSAHTGLAQYQLQATQLRSELTETKTRLQKFEGGHNVMRSIFAAMETPVRAPVGRPGSPHDTGLSPNHAAPAHAMAHAPATSPVRLPRSSPSAAPADPRSPVPPGSAMSEVSDLASRLNADELGELLDAQDDAQDDDESQDDDDEYDDEPTCNACGRVCNSASGLQTHIKSCPILHYKRLKTTHEAFVVVKRGTMHRQAGTTILWTIDKKSRIRDGYTVDRDLVR